MVNYDAFKEMIATQILDYLPEKYADYEVHVAKVFKTNEELDCLQIIPPKNSTDENQILPVLYLNDSYESYKQNGDMYKVLEDMANRYEAGFKQLEGKNFDQISFSDKTNITLQVVNTDKNKELLKSVPHREFCDLSVVYNYCLALEPKRSATVKITNEMLKDMNMTEKELYKLAYENTKRLMPFHCVTQLEMVGNNIREKYKAADIPDVIIQMMIDKYAITSGLVDLPPEREIYLVTNDFNIDGANAILYTDILDTLSEKVNSDLLVVPASINEIYAVSADGFQAENLTALVRSENQSNVDIKDQLSNQVYFYNHADKTLKIASDDIVPLEKEAVSSELNKNMTEQQQEIVNIKRKSR